MIKITTNIGKVTALLTAKLKEAIKDDGILKDKAVRAVASTLAADMKVRIYQEGKNSSDSNIGTYSNSYLKVRQSKYKRTDDSKVVLSLTRQEEADWGIVGKEPIKTSTGYGLGFKNNADYSNVNISTEAKLRKSLNKKTKSGKSKRGKIISVSNAQKAEWHEEQYGQIFKPTKKEEENIIKNYKAYVKSVVDDINR